ncbi:MAG: amino acid carrier protein, partial [Clostridia bacterium]|nr:amino acid carrier protein [Clostridia bacterium]
MLEWITNFNNDINGFVWNYGVYLLIATGLLTTLVTAVFQVSHIRLWWKNTIGSLFKKNVIGHTKDKTISPFQALCTALAATIGVGNIAGVAAAIAIGGPGAVFWMWVAAFLGMMTNYSENVLGIFYRRKNADGEWSGGAMYYLEDGLGAKKGCKKIGKILAILFSIFTLLASFGIGAMGQINKIVINLESAFPIQSLMNVQVFDGVTLYAVILGVILVAIAALITLGGLKRIASFAEKVVPFMVVLFILGSVAIVCVNYAMILPAFKAIFVTAFNPVAVAGGVGGVAISKVMQQGFKRGVFSNEAGLGSSVMVHSNSSVKEPVAQGMWGIFEVFADTMVVCTMGQSWGNTYGTLGAAWDALTMTSGMTVGSEQYLATAFFAALLLWIWNAAIGLSICWFYGKGSGLKKGLPAVLVLSTLQGGGELLMTQINTTVACFIPACLSLFGILILGRTGLYGKPWSLEDSRIMERREPAEEDESEGSRMSLLQAILPYILLSAITLVVLMVGPVKNLLGSFKLSFSFPETVTGYGFVNEASEQFSPLSPFTHASMFLLISSLAGLFYYRTCGFIGEGGAKRVFQRTAKMARPSSIAVLALVIMSKIMSGTGQTVVLANGIAATLGNAYVALAPFIGMLGSFMTGSNMSSNILFGSFQTATAEILGVN